MGLFERLHNLFFSPVTVPDDSLSAEAALRINFKVVVTEFADNVESNGGELLSRLLDGQDGLSVSYFDEPFAKNFLSLESRTLFDLIDKGQTILDKTGADILIWGCREGNKIRLNFQTALQYEKQSSAVISLLDSLYLPAAIFDSSLPSLIAPSIAGLIYGAAVSAVNPADKVAKIQKRYLLKKIIARLSADNSAKSLSIDYLPYVMNFLGIIYLSYCFDEAGDKDFKIVANLFETAIKHQDLIKNPLHLGCIYYHLGQLYDSASLHLNKRPGSFYKGAISYYRLAQKYLGKYNYPYDYGFISYKLAALYYNYWRQKDDIQALRDAVFNLREAEKIFTYALFPDFWANIQGELGHRLALLGSLTGSGDISELAISAYKNQQKVITERRDPLHWAKIQESIGEIYYRLGKNAGDNDFLEEALEYFHDALYIFENMELSEEAKRLTIDISKTGSLLNR